MKFQNIMYGMNTSIGGHTEREKGALATCTLQIHPKENAIIYVCFCITHKGQQAMLT